MSSIGHRREAYDVQLVINFNFRSDVFYDLKKKHVLCILNFSTAMEQVSSNFIDG